MKFTYNSPYLSQIYLRDLFYSLYFAHERELRRYSHDHPSPPQKTNKNSNWKEYRKESGESADSVTCKDEDVIMRTGAVEKMAEI